MLAFYRLDMTYGLEAGDFEVFIGGNSDTEKSVRFTLLEPEPAAPPAKNNGKNRPKHRHLAPLTRRQIDRPDLFCHRPQNPRRYVDLLVLGARGGLSRR